MPYRLRLLCSGGNGFFNQMPPVRCVMKSLKACRVAESLSFRQDEGMKIRSWLTRIGSHLLGVVDEYWAMREPAQYHQQLPCCDLKGDVDSTSSNGKR